MITDTTYKYLFIALILATTICSSSCYTKRPVANISNPDYNSRVNVSSAGYVKRKNAVGIAFSIGAVGAGAYGGYLLAPFQYQNGVEQKSAHVVNIATGALVGAGAVLITDLIMGKNSFVALKGEPQKWINKVNKEYRFLSGNNQNFKMISLKSEDKFIVEKIDDVKDFKQIFPNSVHADKIITDATKKLDRDYLPVIINYYPNHNAVHDTKVKYILTSPSFDELSMSIKKYPLDIEVEDKYLQLIKTSANAIEFKKMYPNTAFSQQAVLNSFSGEDKSSAFTMFALLKQVYFDDIYITNRNLNESSDVNKRNYLEGLRVYERISHTKDLSRLYGKYRWLTYPEKINDATSNYWSIVNAQNNKGLTVINNFKKIIDDDIFREMGVTTKDVASTIKLKLTEEVLKNITIKHDATLSSSNPEWDNWLANNHYAAGLVGEKQVAQYLMYGEIINNSKFDLPVYISGEGSLIQSISVKGTGIISNFIVGLLTDAGAPTTKTNVIANTSEVYEIPLLPANSSAIFAINLNFGVQFTRTGINIGDFIKQQSELILGNILFSVNYLDKSPSAEQLNKQLLWQSMAKNGMPSGKLIDFIRQEEVRQSIWDIRYKQYQEDLRHALQESPNRSNAGNYSNKKEDSEEDSDNIDPNNVYIPSISKIGEWERATGFLLTHTHKCAVKIGDEYVTITRDDESDSYRYGYTRFLEPNEYGFDTFDHAVEAAYVYAKYSLIRTIGKK